MTYEVWVKFYNGSERCVLTTTDKAKAEAELRFYRGGDNQGSYVKEKSESTG